MRQQENVQNFKREFSVQLTKSQFDDRFIQRAQIGEGSTCKVYRAVDTKYGRKVALKYIINKTLDQYNLYSQFIQQINILTLLRESKNQKTYFVQLLQTFKVVHGNDRQRFYMVFQLCDKSYNELVAHPAALMSIPFSDRLEHCISIAEGLKYLHFLDIMHRDLKPANIFIKFQNGKSKAFIGDFGHSKNMTIEMTHNKGSPKYIDPQLKSTNDYQTQWDVYSFGLIILQILTGRFLIQLSPKQMHDYSQFKPMIKAALKNLKHTLNKFTVLSESLKTVIEFCLIQKNKRWKMPKVVQQLKIIYKLNLKNTNEAQKQKISTTNSQNEGTVNNKITQIIGLSSDKKCIQEERRQINKQTITASQNSKIKSEISSNKNKIGSQILITSPKDKKQQEQQIIINKQLNESIENKSSFSSQQSLKCPKQQISPIRKILSCHQNSPEPSSSKKRLTTIQQITKSPSPLKKIAQNKIKQTNQQKANKIEYKLLKANKMMESNQKVYNSRLEQINKLKDMYKQLKKIQILQQMQAPKDKEYKMFLICFAYLHFKTKLKELNQNNTDHMEFINKVKSIFDPKVKLTQQKYQGFLSNQTSKKILCSEIKDRQKIKTQYLHIAKNIQCNLDTSILSSVVN